MRVKENVGENSSEISCALYEPLEQKVSGVCYDSFRLHNTNGHYNGFRIREKKTEPEELVGSPPTEIF